MARDLGIEGRQATLVRWFCDRGRGRGPSSCSSFTFQKVGTLPSLASLQPVPDTTRPKRFLGAVIRLQALARAYAVRRKYGVLLHLPDTTAAATSPFAASFSYTRLTAGPSSPGVASSGSGWGTVSPTAGGGGGCTPLFTYDEERAAVAIQRSFRRFEKVKSPPKGEVPQLTFTATPAAAAATPTPATASSATVVVLATTMTTPTGHLTLPHAPPAAFNFVDSEDTHTWLETLSATTLTRGSSHRSTSNSSASTTSSSSRSSSSSTSTLSLVLL